jgi:hypothetical protein
MQYTGQAGTVHPDRRNGCGGHYRRPHPVGPTLYRSQLGRRQRTSRLNGSLVCCSAAGTSTGRLRDFVTAHVERGPVERLGLLKAPRNASQCGLRRILARCQTIHFLD